jgi:DNA-binding transcriptional MerR regulator
MSYSLTENEICEKLGCNRVTLRRWRQQGMPFKEVNQISILYDFDDVQDWIRSYSKVIRGEYHPREKQKQVYFKKGD